jgi:hypothetical protein
MNPVDLSEVSVTGLTDSNLIKSIFCKKQNTIVSIIGKYYF